MNNLQRVENDPNAKKQAIKILFNDEKWRFYLLGTAGSWLIFDIAFYANSLFNSTITAMLGLGTEPINVSVNSLILAAMALPGYALAVLTIDKITRKELQVIGFIMLVFLYLCLGLFYTNTSGALVIVLYGLTYFFSNFGPNTSTYTIPGEIFPTLSRSTAHGISAASGKVGAFLGAYLLKPLVNDYGLGTVLVICAGLSLFGLMWTYIFIPSTSQEKHKQAAKLPEEDSQTETEASLMFIELREF